MIAPTLLGLSALVLFAGSLNAQGVTSAAIVGKVTQTGGAPVDGAVVTVLNTSTGGRWQAVTRASGRYFLENVATGGPFTIEARGIGFQPARKTGITLNLGQRYTADFELSTAPVELEELAVSAAVNPLINRAKTGPATTISTTAIARYPLLGRDFTNLLGTAPQVVGTSIGGQNNRLNEIQVDGGVNNDLFGLGSTGAPGGQVQSRAVSLDAVKEFQILIAPFDLRQGNFTGGLVNAITKSGTNEYHASVFGYRQSSNDLGIRLVGDTCCLVGNEVGDTVSDFSVTQFGGTFSGPIVRDKAHFFFSADIQDQSIPFDGVTLSEAGALASDVTRMQAVLDAAGLDGGSAGTFTTLQPNDLFLGKIDWQVADNSRLALTYNYVTAGEGTILRSQNDDYGLSSHSYNQQFTGHTIRANLNSVISDRFSNELILGYSRLRDIRKPASTFPTINVESGTAELLAGAERFSHDNALDQDVWEITDNFTFDVGEAHRITIGSHNEYFKFRNVFFPQSLGQWTFDSIDDFEAGIPAKYDRAIALIPGGPEASFKVYQLGLYLQDRWSPTPDLTITGGVRADLPVFPDSPRANSALAASQIGVSTDDFPSGNILWSPRVGFNYDVKGDQTTIVRGGAGFFAGRPAYVWLSNAFSNSGGEQADIDCFGSAELTAAYNGPATELDACPGAGGPTAGIPNINAFDPDFKFQQNIKLALGLDQQLPWGMVGTLDLLYTMGRNTLYYTDENLDGPTGVVVTGEADRVLYGDVTGGFGDEDKVDDTVARNVLFGQNPGALNTDMSEDRSYQITGQLQKRFANGISFNAGYTYSDAENLFDLTSSTASSQYGFNVLDGTLEKRNRTTSVFERRHKLTLSGSADIPLPESWPVQADFSLTYVGVSGTPYSYVVDGDVNADGIGDGRQINDEFYVPLNAGDITLDPGSDPYQDLEQLIQDEPCLREQRGQLNERNSCRNPWANFLNTRLTFRIPTYRGSQIELGWDIFNVLNFIDGDWGVVRRTSNFSGAEIVEFEGWDAANDRGIYSLSLPNFERVQDFNTRWRMQFGAKYTY
jgi:hypothetical protein